MCPSAKKARIICVQMHPRALGTSLAVNGKKQARRVSRDYASGVGCDGARSPQAYMDIRAVVSDRVQAKNSGLHASPMAESDTTTKSQKIH